MFKSTLEAFYSDVSDTYYSTTTTTTKKERILQMLARLSRIDYMVNLDDDDENRLIVEFLLQYRGDDVPAIVKTLFAKMNAAQAKRCEYVKTWESLSRCGKHEAADEFQEKFRIPEFNDIRFALVMQVFSEEELKQECRRILVKMLKYEHTRCKTLKRARSDIDADIDDCATKVKCLQKDLNNL